MPSNDFRVVLDTNIVVRAFINMRSDSGRIFKLCEQRIVVPLLNTAVLDEYRYIHADPKLVARYPQVDRPEVGVALERLTYVSDNLRRIRTRFAYPRDPKDAHLIELAIAGRATHLISNDKDLLCLTSSRDEAATRFRQLLPKIQVLKAEEFLRRFQDVLKQP